MPRSSRPEAGPRKAADSARGSRNPCCGWHLPEKTQGHLMCLSLGHPVQGQHLTLSPGADELPPASPAGWLVPSWAYKMYFADRTALHGALQGSPTPRKVSFSLRSSLPPALTALIWCLLWGMMRAGLLPAVPQHMAPQNPHPLRAPGTTTAYPAPENPFL